MGSGRVLGWHPPYACYSLPVSLLTQFSSTKIPRHTVRYLLPADRGQWVRRKIDALTASLANRSHPSWAKIMNGKCCIAE